MVNYMTDKRVNNGRYFSLLLVFILIFIAGTHCTVSAQENSGVVALGADQTIFLDGKDGDDEENGSSKDLAVRTFAKAKELAMNNRNIKRILVIGTVSIEGDVSLAGTDAELVRDKDFIGYLFSVEGKDASLSKITIDGNAGEAIDTEKSLIYVSNGATLTVAEEAVLKNNTIKAIPNTATKGGAIHAVSSTIKMTGGSIQNNQATYGGGICLDKSRLDFSAGIIKDNRSIQVKDRSVNPPQYYSAGGGVLAENGSRVNMSGAAEIRDNFAAEVGGGISLGSNEWGPTNVLNMEGGVVDSNSAGAAGGGVFIQAKYFTGGASKAHIHGGQITNNKMTGQGSTNKMFGGGGIYVNGANKMYGANGANGQLYLENAIVTDNTADRYGGGYASCPISETHIAVEDGVAIYGNAAARNHYGNAAARNHKEIYILSSQYLGLHSGTPSYKISERMLGGLPYYWHNEKGEELPIEQLEGRLEKNNEYLALYTDESGQTIRHLAKVIISGNTSTTHGGGIGSNGTVRFGKTENKPVKLMVKKTWDDGLERKEIGIQLRGRIGEHDWLIEEVALNQDNNFQYTFNNLPQTIMDIALKNVVYIKELGVDPDGVEITPMTQHSEAEDGSIVFLIKLHNKIPEIPTIPTSPTNPIFLPTETTVPDPPTPPAVVKPSVPATGEHSSLGLVGLILSLAILLCVSRESFRS